MNFSPSLQTEWCNCNMCERESSLLPGVWRAYKDESGRLGEKAIVSTFQAQRAAQMP